PGRRLALEFLADLGRPASEAVGAALLNDPSWRVRRHAAALLGRLQGGGMSTALRDALADPDLRVRRAAAEALAAQGARGLHWRFVRVLERESADPLARAAAADALTALGAPGAAPALRDALAAEDFRIACAAADALGALAADDPDADTRAALVGALRTRPFPVNAAAALALAKRSGQPFAAVVEEVP
ncbi:MAG: HEAT repeat domain-containing protein, partial [Planctomycetota bacterium]